MDKNKLASYIIKGLKGVNDITENIDFKKTTTESITKQLNNKMDNSFSSIKNSENVEEDFFSFLKKNEKPLQHIRIYIIYPAETQTLKEHIEGYFRNVQKKYKEDKMFYFYFQLIMMENFLKKYNKQIPRQDLKQYLKDILKNQCRREKIVLSKCLGNLENDAVEVMSEFGQKIDRGCKLERDSLEICVTKNFTRR